MSLKSFEPAVMPVTLTSAPLTLPIVCGTTSSRSVASAASERASVPSPASGMSTIASVWSGFVVTVTGWPKPFVSAAVCFSSAMPACTAGALTSSASTTTEAGSGPPGNLSWMRS